MSARCATRNYEPAGSLGGRNYGWRVLEGFHAFNPEEATLCNQPRLHPAGVTLPIAEYSHRSGQAVTGGYVYRPDPTSLRDL